MEHRWYSRKQSSLNALLYHQGRCLCACHIENVSPNGLFINVPDIRIDSGASVDVVVNALPYTTKPVWSKAIVVHNEQYGVGLMCVGANPLYTLIKDMW